MTKPRNFPGRVNTRRRKALDRFQEQLRTRTKANSGKSFRLTDEDHIRLTREGDTLALRIVNDMTARSTRTKKNRSGTGRLARAA